MHILIEKDNYKHRNSRTLRVVADSTIRQIDERAISCPFESQFTMDDFAGGSDSIFETF